MLRVTKDRIRKYSSIGIFFFNPAYWNFKKNSLAEPANRLHIERLIGDG